jgi:hypothetical protein
LGVLVLLGALDGKTQRFYPNDGPTIATEGAGRYAFPAFLLVGAALAAVWWTAGSVRAEAWGRAVVAAALASFGFAAAALFAHRRLAALARDAAAADRYEVWISRGLGIAAWAAPAATVAALVLTGLLIVRWRMRLV